MKKLMFVLLVVLMSLVLSRCAQYSAQARLIDAHTELVKSEAGINDAKAGAIDKNPNLAIETTSVQNTRVKVYYRKYGRTSSSSKTKADENYEKY